MSILKIFKNPWLLYLSILLMWISISFHLDPFSELYDFLFMLAAIALILSFIFIIYKIIDSSKKEVHKIFFKLSALPLLVIGSHLLVFISGKTFNDVGRWWILYALLMICPVTSLILVGIGALIKINKTG